MGQKEKLIKHLKSNPKDFTFNDAETLLNYFGYVRSRLPSKYYESSDVLNFE